MRSFLTPELVIAIATAALAFATVFLAVETRNIAKATTQTLALEKIPILGVRNLRVEITSHNSPAAPAIASIKVGIELFNAGRFPVKYYIKSFAVALADEYMMVGDFRGGRVHPGASTTVWREQWDFRRPISTFPAKGRVEFTYAYSDELGQQEPTTTEKLEYIISSPLMPMSALLNSYKVRWSNVD